jgi:hypothetical protein
VKAEIERLAAARRERITLRADLTLEKLMNDLSKIAFADVRKVVRWNGKGEMELTPSAEIDDDTAAAIQRVWRGKDGQIRVDMYDKRQALTDMAEHFGMRLTTGKVNIAIGSGSIAQRPDLSGLSNDRLAQLEEMFLALEAETLPPLKCKKPLRQRQNRSKRNDQPTNRPTSRCGWLPYQAQPRWPLDGAAAPRPAGHG